MRFCVYVHVYAWATRPGIGLPLVVVGVPRLNDVTRHKKRLWQQRGRLSSNQAFWTVRTREDLRARSVTGPASIPVMPRSRQVSIRRRLPLGRSTTGSCARLG